MQEDVQTMLGRIFDGAKAFSTVFLSDRLASRAKLQARFYSALFFLGAIVGAAIEDWGWLAALLIVSAVFAVYGFDIPRSSWRRSGASRRPTRLGSPPT